MRPGQGKELQDRRRDHAERSFGTDEELLQVIAGVVLAQAAQALPHLPGGQHDLESQREFAGIAVAQYRGAARVGGKIAADFATAFGRKAQGEEAPPFFSLANTQPASAVMVLLRASTSRIRFMRERLRTICVPLASGVAAPQRPVFPP